MINFFKLIRIQNLLIIVLTQYVMRWLIIFPVINYFNYCLGQVSPFCPCLKILRYDMLFTELNFFFLVLSTVLLAAAGYVINDYFDRKTDLVNRPETVIVDMVISSRAAIIIHSVFNFVAVLLGFYISYKIGHLIFGFGFVMIAGILWFYSTSYKRQMLVGNIIVSLLTALVPLTVLVYELPLLYKTFGSYDCSCKLIVDFDAHQDFLSLVHTLKVIILSFAFFAFIITLLREIVKDIEDLEGDRTYGRRSLPVVAGVKWAKTVVIALASITILSLALTYYNTWAEINISFWYFIFALILPLLYFIFKIVRANSKEDFHFASGLIKLIMLFGLIYSLIIFSKLYLFLK